MFEQMQEQVTPATSELDEWNQRAERQLVEETSRRATFLLKLDILAELNRVSKDKKRGFKTWFVNQAIKEKLARVNEEDRVQQQRNPRP